MGRGASNVTQRIAARLGQADAVAPEFQHALDVPCAGVLFALPAVLALGLLDKAQESLNPLPKGSRPGQHLAAAGLDGTRKASRKREPRHIAMKDLPEDQRFKG